MLVFPFKIAGWIYNNSLIKNWAVRVFCLMYRREKHQSPHTSIDPIPMLTLVSVLSILWSIRHLSLRNFSLCFLVVGGFRYLCFDVVRDCGDLQASTMRPVVHQSRSQGKSALIFIHDTGEMRHIFQIFQHRFPVGPRAIADIALGGFSRQLWA